MPGFTLFEDEKLLELVHKNPPLYDGRLASYKDHIVKENIWQEITNSMNKSSDECKKRWKYMRDSYNRHKRKNKLPTGSATPKIAKWSLLERIRFLDNIPTERPTVCTIQDTYSVSEADLGMEETTEAVLVTNEQEISDVINLSNEEKGETRFIKKS